MGSVLLVHKNFSNLNSNIFLLQVFLPAGCCDKKIIIRKFNFHSDFLSSHNIVSSTTSSGRREKTTNWILKVFFISFSFIFIIIIIIAKFLCAIGCSREPTWQPHKIARQTQKIERSFFSYEKIINRPRLEDDETLFALLSHPTSD